MVQSIFEYIKQQKAEQIQRQEAEATKIRIEHARQEQEKQDKHDAIQQAYLDFLEKLKTVSEDPARKALVDNLIAKAQKLTQSNESDERLEDINKIMKWAINGFEKKDSDEPIKTAVAKEISSDITDKKINEWYGCIALSVLAISVFSPLTYYGISVFIQGGNPDVFLSVLGFATMLASSIYILVGTLSNRPVPNLGSNIAEIDSYLTHMGANEALALKKSM